MVECVLVGCSCMYHPCYAVPSHLHIKTAVSTVFSRPVHNRSYPLLSYLCHKHELCQAAQAQALFSPSAATSFSEPLYRTITRQSIFSCVILDRLNITMPPPGKARKASGTHPTFRKQPQRPAGLDNRTNAFSNTGKSTHPGVSQRVHLFFVHCVVVSV
jgi:hypothetical protein